MEKRILISDIKNHIGETITINGFVDLRRDHGKIVFIDLRDRSAKVQIVVSERNTDAYGVLSGVKPEWVLSVTGVIKKRGEKTINPNVFNGDLEMEATSGEIFQMAEELPFEKEQEITLETYLNYLPLTLRTDRARAIFRIQARITDAFGGFLRENGFTEIQVPKIIGEDAEGGANVFNLDYFGHIAHLAQSPQFYKQIMVGVFERVFCAGNVYRAEPHSTTRHLNEYTSLDFEMGFIKSHEDIMEMETRMMEYIMADLKKNCAEDFKTLNAVLPDVPEKIPAMKLREIQELIKKETGEDCCNAPDLEPKHERWLYDYALKNFGSEFIFVTHFPISKRPMYTYEDENDPGYAKGFDLLFRGIEITTGGQRIHDYNKLVESMEKKGLDPKKFSYYLQAFKYGMPPHGGLGLGLERLTAKLVGVENIREATLFPRDMHRIDTLLSEEKKEKKD
ncbi:MAG: aspartate--tRNA(Asn) ligase [Candidatus Pacebacteria bacterium]|nr:aspartate--tRNA(Asn) ligase [Candidatus Paceibacterota bacterium]